MSRDSDALEADLLRWMETYSRLHSKTRFQKEASFAIGAVHGCLETLEALGYDDVEEALLARVRSAVPPGEIELAKRAIARWLGRSEGFL